LDDFLEDIWQKIFSQKHLVTLLLNEKKEDILIRADTLLRDCFFSLSHLNVYSKDGRRTERSEKEERHFNQLNDSVGGAFVILMLHFRAWAFSNRFVPYGVNNEVRREWKSKIQTRKFEKLSYSKSLISCFVFVFVFVFVAIYVNSMLAQDNTR
jgi:hypothetical protein